MKLFFIEEIRHSAVVMANNQKEAIELATKAHGEKSGVTGVLFGSVGDWEVLTACELKLPEGYRIVEEKKERKKHQAGASTP
jgi:hypothetical protein